MQSHPFVVGGFNMNDYNDLDNKPTINGNELTSNMSLNDIGLVEMTPEMVTESFLEIFGYIITN